MKPSAFEYARPNTLEDALALLEKDPDGAKILAGGQTLVPLLNFRMLAPSRLVDINGIGGLAGIESDAEGGLRLGALVRWRDILASPLIRDRFSLLAEAVRHIAHYQIRNRGTWAGSCAHADPAAEFPAIALLCDARFVLRSLASERVVGAAEFFVGVLTTALKSNEILVEVRFPPILASRRWGFSEFSARRGDFAIAGAAAIVEDRASTSDAMRLVVFGSGAKASRVQRAESFIARTGLGKSAIEEAARLAGADVPATSDAMASAEYRRALTAEQVKKVLDRVASVPAGKLH